MDSRQDHFFTKLYIEHFDFLYSLACSLLHDDHFGYDLVQDTFQVALLRIDELMEHTNPTGWLVQTMKYKLAHILRDQKLLIELREEISAYPNERHAFEECENNWKERWEKVLSKVEISMLQRYYGEGYPIHIVAQEYGISVDACYKRLQRAKEKLRKLIEQENNR